MVILVKRLLKIILWIILVLYVLLVLFISFLILEQNAYGITEINNNSYIIINDHNENDTYKKGELVIVKNLTIDDIEENDEFFYYESDENNNIFARSAIAYKTFKNTEEKYITIENKEEVIKEENIIGKRIKVFKKYGGMIEYLENRWIFFIFIILPCSFLAVYETFYIFRNFIFVNRERIQ